MADKTVDTGCLFKSRTQPKYPVHQKVLILLWLLSTLTIVVMLMLGVRETNRFSILRSLLQAAYVLVLLWYLGCSGASYKVLPEIKPVILPRWKYSAWIPVLLIAIIFAWTLISDSGVSDMNLLMILSIIPILIAWRREIQLWSIILSILLMAIAYGALLPMIESGFLSGTVHILMTVLAVPLFICGVLFTRHTGLGESQLQRKRFLPSLRSFLLGCLLFLPLGLFNAASESAGGTNFTWVNQTWMPFVLPFWSGIVEETWYRFFLAGLCYFLIRPAFPEKPALAIILAVLFSGIIFGIGHGRTLDHFLTTGLLYGVPFAAVFTRRDWEHAVGAHYMVNMIPWLMVFLEAS